jgi:hypothetical protein
MPLHPISQAILLTVSLPPENQAQSMIYNDYLSLDP